MRARGRSTTRHDGRVETDGLLPSEVARFEEVCRFGQERLEPLARTIAASFADDPIWKWIYHGGDAALTIDQALPFARWLVAEMSSVDEIHGFRHHDAVALWHAPLFACNQEIVAAHAATTTPFVDALGPVLGERLQLIGALGDAMAQRRPAEPHWYLGIIGTHPDRQGEGLGAELLGSMHARCDRLGLACFLESSNPQNYGFYRRHGYVEAGDFSAAESPRLMAFRREPR